MLSFLIGSAFAVIIDPRDRVFRDKYGREVVYHAAEVQNGFNFTNQTVDVIKEFGLNAVKLSLRWDLIETTLDSYNTTYLEELNQTITTLG